MKPGDLVKRCHNLSRSSRNLVIAHEEALAFNRKINIIWAFATNRSTPPPYDKILIPPDGPALLLDNQCEEFYDWVKNSRFEDPRNILSTPVVKLLHNGEIVITFLKWIEVVNQNQQKNMNF